MKSSFQGAGGWVKEVPDAIERQASGEMQEVSPEDPGFFEESSHPYHDPVPVSFVLPTRLYGGMLAVWHVRRWIQKRFPLHRGRMRDFVRFLAWCATDGRKHYCLLREIPSWNRELSGRTDLPSIPGDVWSGTFSNAMFFTSVALGRYTFSPVLRDAAWRNQTAVLFWRGERHRRWEPPPAPWQLQALHQRFGSYEKFLARLKKPGESGLTCEELTVQLGLEDVREAFLRIEDAGGVEESPASNSLELPETGWESLRKSRWKVPLPVVQALNPLLAYFEKEPNEFQIESVVRGIDPTKPPPRNIAGAFGVNLFGYARGELGIGEDVRMVAAALDASGVPNCIVDVQPGKNISQLDNSMAHKVRAEPEFGINLFCVTGIEQSRLVCEKGSSLLEGRYNIGFWPWEMPLWPASCRYAYSNVDEIWGISSHTAKAYRGNAPVPVVSMSLPVAIPEIPQLTRRDFGLPESAYLFVFAFDINSKVARKNPEGVVAAFQEAFRGESAREVGLVLKVCHADTPCEAWKRIRGKIARDPRIHLFEQTWRKPRVLSLFNICDCFVSLHRAEGFGRCLAEALLLGKRVITTGYSGNLDFCSEPRVQLVHYRKRAVRAREYFWSEGQLWAEPDLAHAAQCMREARTAPKTPWAAPYDFSPARMGENYRLRLESLWKKLDAGV